MRENVGDFWTVRGKLEEVGGGLTAASAFGLFVGLCVAQTNSLFSADAWNNITFTAGEVRNPRRDIPLSLALGTFLVVGMLVARRVTSGVPGRLQAAMEFMIEMVDSQAKAIVHNATSRKMVAPMALTVFV